MDDAMKKLRVLDLFSGIGGFSLGLERTGGFETVAFCEIDPFCRRVLAKHWPDVPCFEDVTTLRGEDVGPVDVVCGGFPCQDLSVAGKGEGLDGSRSGLWTEIARLVSELRPRFVIVENVANLLAGPSSKPGGWFGRVLGDLAERGYDAEWRNIPAWLVGRPHSRERVWLVAYPQQERWEGILPHFLSEREAEVFGQGQAAIALAASSDLDRRTRGDLDGQPPFFDGTDGFPDLVAGLGAGGNAVVPAIPEIIGHAILESMRASS